MLKTWKELHVGSPARISFVTVYRILLLFHLVEGASNDYTVNNIQSLDVRPNRNATVQLTLRVDNVALEPDETLSLRLIPTNPLAINPGSNAFLLETIQITVEDSDGKHMSIPVFSLIHR